MFFGEHMTLYCFWNARTVEHDGIACPSRRGSRYSDERVLAVLVLEVYYQSVSTGQVPPNHIWSDLRPLGGHRPIFDTIDVLSPGTLQVREKLYRKRPGDRASAGSLLVDDNLERRREN